ncbi:TetR/AcrR family transcriptional regulator C-terminal domain-containing protein [Streptomyces sp. NPDC048717]|uniref:TetR/AcrR family transcriptional regulator n=1 Tax=Streptomyces sp. NPDC048717 TaxID=3154928 RepID=UPI003420C0F9
MVRAADRAKNPTRSSVWLEQDKESRAARGVSGGSGPAGLDRERIVAASIRMLDEDGLAKLSMRRLATELNVTAMSLYWYVDTKDDIIEYAIDSCYEEIDLAEVAAADGWRERIRVLALAYRRMLTRHQWLSACMGQYLNVGPHAIAVGNEMQRAIRDTGLPLSRVPSAMSAVFQFVYGYGTIEGQFTRVAQQAGMSQDDFYTGTIKAFREEEQFKEVLEDMTDLLDERLSHGTVDEIWDRDFLYALDVLIAGIEVMVERGRGEAAAESAESAKKAQRAERA